MRTSGATCDQIAAALEISKSTVWLYVRNLPVPPNLTLAARRGRRVEALLAAGQRRFAARDRQIAVLAQAFIDRFDIASIDLVFLGLYWGEGTKSGDYFEFVNADPGAIMACMVFLKSAGIPIERVSGEVYYYPDLDKRATVAYWATITGLDEARIYALLKPAGTSIRRRRLPYGTFHVRVFDKPLVRLLLANIDSIRTRLKDGQKGAI